MRIRKKIMGLLSAVAVIISYFSVMPVQAADMGNHTPEDALEISASMIGVVQEADATSNDDWYYISMAANMKATVLLVSPDDSDYDIYVYRYDSTADTLVEIADAQTAATLERVSFVSSDAGLYYIEITPYQPVATSGITYNYAVVTGSTFDAYEPNDSYSQMYALTTDMVNVTGTIDNGFDIDWYSYQPTTSGKYRFELSNVPADMTYYFELYDSNWNAVASLSASPSFAQSYTLTAGTYYMLVCSDGGDFSTTQPYNLKISPVKTYTSHGGKSVEVTPTALYIDGVEANLNWSFLYNILYTREQHLYTRSDTVIDVNSYANGYYRDTQNINKSSDCIRIKIKNFRYTYYCSNSPGDTEDNVYTTYYYLYVDANTGQAIDTSKNYYIDVLGMPYQWNQY